MDSAQIRDVAIYAGPDEATVRKRMLDGVPLARIEQCAASDGLLGNVWLVREQVNEPFVAVVAGLAITQAGTRTERSAVECNFEGSTFTSKDPNCLFAVRRFRYSEDNRRATLTVRLEKGCVDVECAIQGQTCTNGVCSGVDVKLPGDDPPEPGPIVDAGNTRDSSAEIVLPFTCRAGVPIWSPPLECSGVDSACVVLATGTASCMNTTKMCLSPCCTAAGMGDPVIPNECCIVDLIGVGAIPLGAPVEAGGCKKTPACFSAEACAKCGGRYASPPGWGECAPQGKAR
jgi:hypothetical protein